MIAVADAVVVTAVNGLAEQVPESPLVGITLETADGNHVSSILASGITRSTPT